MNFWKPIIIFHLTIVSIDITHGVPLRQDGADPTKDESTSTGASSSTPNLPLLAKSYRKALEFKPQEMKVTPREKQQSKVAIQNQKKRERKKEQRAQQESLTRILFSGPRKEYTSQRDFSVPTIMKDTSGDGLSLGKMEKSPTPSNTQAAVHSHETDLFWGATTSSQIKSGSENKNKKIREDIQSQDFIEKVPTLLKRMAMDEKSNLGYSVSSSHTTTSGGKSTDGQTIVLSQQNKQGKLKASKEDKKAETSRSPNSLDTVLVQDNTKKSEGKIPTVDTKRDEHKDKTLEVSLSDRKGTSQKRQSFTEQILTSQPEIIPEKMKKSYASVVNVTSSTTPKDSQQSSSSIPNSKRWADMSSDDEELPPIVDLHEKWKEIDEKEMGEPSTIEPHTSEASNEILLQRIGSLKKPDNISHHSSTMQQAVSIEKRGVDTSQIPVQPDKATSGLLSALKKSGVLKVSKDERGKATQVDGGMETSGTYKKEDSANIARQSLIENTPSISETSKVSKIRKNALMITFKTKEAFNELEQSNIKPIASAVSRIVKLKGSGIVVTFHSDQGVDHLINKLTETIGDIDRKLLLKVVYFKYNIVCIHDIPQKTTIQELVYVILYQYQEKPSDIWFVTYRPGLKDTFKIALLDVSYSLLIKIKQNSITQVQNMPRRIQIFLLSGLAELEHSMSENSRESNVGIEYTEVLLPKILEDISKEEIIWCFMKKYKESPLTIEFIPYTNIHNMKMALLHISGKLLKKIVTSPIIQIRWGERIIITNIELFRCLNCQRLGHKTEHCWSSNYYQPQTPHENCVDCSSHGRRYITPDMTINVAENSNHMTDDDECIRKHFYVQKSLNNPKSHRFNVAHYIKNNAPTNYNYAYVTQRLKIGAKFAKLEEHKELAPITSQTSISILKRPSELQVIPNSLNSTSHSNVTNFQKNLESSFPIQSEKGIPPIPQQPPSTESSKLHLDAALISPSIKTSHEKSIATAQELDMSTPVDYGADGPESVFMNLRNPTISEAVQQSVQETLINALPSIYKMIIETVYERIQETEFKSTKTSSHTHESASSEEEPIFTEYVPQFPTTIDDNKGKNKMQDSS